MITFEYFIKSAFGLMNLPLYLTLFIVILFIVSYKLIENRYLLTNVHDILPNEEFHNEFLVNNLQDQNNTCLSTDDDDTRRIEDLVQTSVEANVNDQDAQPMDFRQDCIQLVQPFVQAKEISNETKSDTRSGILSKESSTIESINPVYFQIVFLGDSGVGKTSFIRQYCASCFEERISGTISVDLMTKKLSVDGKPVILHLWDTAGQERFRSISTQYLRKADCIIAMYDINTEDSLTNIRDWLASAEEMLGNLDRLVVGIVANKSDLLFNKFKSEREEMCKHDGCIDEDDDVTIGNGYGNNNDEDDDEFVHYMSLLEGKLIAKNMRASFGMCSSKTGRGITKFMDVLCSRLMLKWNVAISTDHQNKCNEKLQDLKAMETKNNLLEKTKTFECC